MKKSRLLIIIVLLAALSGWLLKDRLSYHYNVWRMTQTVEDKEIVEYNEKIQALHDKTGNSCFVDTYNDTTKPNRVRRAAAMALIKSDVAVAETVFKQHLNSTNPDVSGMAIRDLGTIKSKTFRDGILQKINSANEIIRWSVADYLGNFQDSGAMVILESIRDSDKSEMVRNHADVRLKHLLKQ